jgi:hypothetical protein
MMSHQDGATFCLSLFSVLWNCPLSPCLEMVLAGALLWTWFSSLLAMVLLYAWCNELCFYALSYPGYCDYYVAWKILFFRWDVFSCFCWSWSSSRIALFGIHALDEALCPSNIEDFCPPKCCKYE